MVEEVLVRMGLDQTAVAKGLRSVKEMMADSAKDMRSGFNTVMEHVGAMFSAGALIAGIEKVFEKVHALRIEAENLGASFEGLQGFKTVAEHVGPGAEKGVKALGLLNQTLGEAIGGAEDATKKFNKFGLSVGDLAGKDSIEVMARVADVIKGIPDPAQRAAAAFELMGKSGREMVGMLSLGGEKLREMMDEAAKLTEAEARAIESAHRNIEEETNRLGVLLGKGIAWVADLASAMGRATLSANTRVAAALEENFQAHKRAVDKLIALEKTKEDALKAADANAAKSAKKKEEELRPYEKRARVADDELKARAGGAEPGDAKFLENKIAQDTDNIADLKRQLNEVGEDEIQQARLKAELKEAELAKLKDEEALKKKIAESAKAEAEAVERRQKRIHDLNKSLTHTEREIAQRTDKSGSFSLEDLAHTSARWGFNSNGVQGGWGWQYAPGAQQAQQVLQLRQWAKQNALWGNLDLARQQNSRSDEIFDSIKKANPFLNDPMEDLKDQAKRTSDVLEAVKSGNALRIAVEDD